MGSEDWPVVRVIYAAGIATGQVTFATTAPEWVAWDAAHLPPVSDRCAYAGGRLAITDVVAADHLSATDRAERGPWVGCIAGALTKAEYQAGLTAAGFTDISVTSTHPVGDGLHSAIITATRPPNPTTPPHQPPVAHQPRRS